LRPMGRQARGVRGVRTRTGDRVVSALALSGSGELLTVTEGGYGKKTPIADYTLAKNRGNYGMRTIKITDTNGPVVNVLEVEEHFQLFLITQLGKLIRIPVENIRTIGRVTQGNRLIHLEKDEQVIGIAPMIENEEEEIQVEQQETTISETNGSSISTAEAEMPVKPEIHTSEIDSDDS
ncbi:MAG: DNA gyrase subunit A, partial [SAR324 cluster bacterium]|nr:DNA gyrase subunit A [SAR324 cluster bacterium]